MHPGLGYYRDTHGQPKTEALVEAPAPKLPDVKMRQSLASATLLVNVANVDESKSSIDFQESSVCVVLGVEQNSRLFVLSYCIRIRPTSMRCIRCICVSACVCSALRQVVLALVVDGATSKFVIQVRSLLSFECYAAGVQLETNFSCFTKSHACLSCVHFVLANH